MKALLEQLSLRYKLTLAALAVEAVMLGFLITNGVQFRFCKSRLRSGWRKSRGRWRRPCSPR